MFVFLQMQVSRNYATASNKSEVKVKVMELTGL